MLFCIYASQNPPAVKSRILILSAMAGWLVSLTTTAQIGFHRGFIINNDHEKIDCEISNYGSENSSMDYYYRLSRNDTARHIDIRHVEAFGVGDKRFFRARVLLEISPANITVDTAPPLKWDERFVFVQLLFDGELGSLYEFNDNGVSYFFLGLPDQPIEPLVYKKYFVKLTPNEPSSILENHLFREQLRKKLFCPSLAGELDKLAYTRKQLIAYFKDYHECKNAGYKILTRVTRAKWNFKASFLFNRSTFQIDDTQDFTGQIDLGPAHTVSGGLEIEYLIPHNKYKLSLFAEANYYYRHSTLHNPVTSETTTVHFQYMEFPAGLNYYFILHDRHKLFVRAGIVPGFYTGDSYASLYNDANRIDLNMVTSVFLGAGYRFNRVSLEYRYYTRQNQMQNIYRYNSTHTRMAFVLKFSFWEPGG